MAVRVAVDAVGGDHAPGVVIEGALQALTQSDGDLHVVLVGPEDEVRAALAEHDTDGRALDVLDAPEVIEMAESPAAAVKTKKRSSIHIGLGAHKNGAVDAFASAGNTGAVMAASLFILGRLPGVSRPALPGFFPTTKSYSFVIDVGANVDSKPEHLVQFAQMGQVYAERVMQREDATVGLLNVGEEPGKGNEAAKAAHDLLAEHGELHFVGNIEGRDIMHHAADVIVCDGFVGNIVLKLGESLRTALPELLRAEIKAQGLGPDEIGLIQRVFGNVTKPFSYEEYGGVPLLGVDGTAVVGHGGSSARAIAAMIRRAAECARQDVSGAIATALAD
jgi:glycerol-3-phosphate acyltransferase PlsX